MSGDEKRRTVTCADCGRRRMHQGRGLCASCHSRACRTGTVETYALLHIPAEWLVENYEFLARQGYTRALAAERMGITKKRLEKAIERHSRRLQEAS